MAERNPESVREFLDQLRFRAETLEADIKERSKQTEPVDADEESTEDALAASKLRLSTLKLDQREQDMNLRKTLAYWSIGLVLTQVFAANVFFGFYLWHNATNPEAAIMVGWLGATVIEVVGILWVIARNLFPYRDKSAPNGKRDNGRSL